MDKKNDVPPPNIKKGWTNDIKEKLAKYNLETDFETIRKKTKGEWKRNVTEAVDKINRKKLIQECETKTSEGTKIKTKTIHSHLTATTTYNRIPVKEITMGNKQRSKTLILARHGMLECGTNFKGSLSEICRHCNLLDDEDHRLNVCTYISRQYCSDNVENCEFTDIYSNNLSF